MPLASIDFDALKALTISVKKNREQEARNRELDSQPVSQKLVTSASIFNKPSEFQGGAAQTLSEIRKYSQTLQKEKIESVVSTIPDQFIETEERAAILSNDTGLSYNWALCVTYVLNCPKPRRLPVDSSEGWDAAKKACNELCKNNFKWLKLLIKSGYSLHDIFGCAPTYPLSTFESKGFILWLDRAQSIQNVFEDKIKVVSFTKNVVSWGKPNYNQRRILLYELD